jgi:hypothetical protein
MTPSAFLQAFFARSHPKEMRLIVARGTAPLPPDEMLELLVAMARDEDSDVAAQAAATLQSWPAEDTLPQVQSRECPESVLDYFARLSSDHEILEAVILNVRTPGSAIEALAARAPSGLLETILLNRVRLLEHPGILQSVKLNPCATPQVQRLVQEVEQEFSRAKSRSTRSNPERPRPRPGRLTSAHSRRSSLSRISRLKDCLSTRKSARECCRSASQR